MNYLKKTYKYTLLIVVLSLIAACGASEKENEPKDLLDEKTMGLVLADFLLLENHIIQYSATRQEVRYDKLQFYSYPIINEKYNLTDSQAYHSYQYYLENPQKFKRVIGFALDSLNKIVENTTPESAE